MPSASLQEQQPHRHPPNHTHPPPRPQPQGEGEEEEAEETRLLLHESRPLTVVRARGASSGDTTNASSSNSSNTSSNNSSDGSSNGSLPSPVAAVGATADAAAGAERAVALHAAAYVLVLLLSLSLYAHAFELLMDAWSFTLLVSMLLSAAGLLGAAAIAASLPAPGGRGGQQPTLHDDDDDEGDNTNELRCMSDGASSSPSTMLPMHESASPPLALSPDATLSPRTLHAMMHPPSFPLRTYLRCWPRLRRYVLVPLPYLLALQQSVRRYLAPRTPGIEMSIQINLVIFLSLFAGMVLFSMLVWAVVWGRKWRMGGGGTLVVVSVTVLALLVQWYQARSAFMHGVHTPAMIMDPDLYTKLPDGADAAAMLADPHNAHLLARMQDYAAKEARYNPEPDSASAPPLPPLPLSLLDTPAEWDLRRAQAPCVPPPAAHPTDVLPRRTLSFWLGTEPCPSTRKFSHMLPPAPASVTSGGGGGGTERRHLLVTDCPNSPERPLRFVGTPDYWSPRDKNNYPDEWAYAARYVAEVFEPEQQRLRNLSMAQWPQAKPPPDRMDASSSVEPPCVPVSSSDEDNSHTASKPPSSSSPVCRIDTGPHEYFSVRCGAEENFYVEFKERPAVTQRAQQVLQTLFAEDQANHAAAAVDTAAAADATATSVPAAQKKGSAAPSSPPSASSPPPPTVVNPPVLILLFDALSRLHLLRSLPETASVLRSAHRHARPAREAREKVYQAQLHRRRMQEQQDADWRKDAEAAAVARAAAIAAGQLPAQAQQQSISARRKRATRMEALRTADAAITSALNAAPPAPPPPSSHGERQMFSVYENYLSHSVMGNTRTNNAMFICASGKHGWGAALEPATINITSNSGVESTRTIFRGGGQPLPPVPSPESRSFACEAEDTLWHRASDAGYVTSMTMNDCTDLTSMLFKDRVKGTSHSADYELVSPFSHPDYDHRGKWSWYQGPFSYRRRCMVGQPVHTYSINYADGFIRHHDALAQPWLLYLQFIEPHESTLSVMALLDADIASFLRRVLFDTLHPPIIILASDHGNQMAPYSATPAGHTEYAAGVAFTAVPEKWIYYWDVTHKQNAQAQGLTDAAAAAAPPSSAADWLPPFSHTSPSPSSPSFLRESVGLNLYLNQHVLVAVRDVYWWIRSIPQRSLEHASATDKDKAEQWEQIQQQWIRERWTEARQLMLRPPALASEAQPSQPHAAPASSNSYATYSSSSSPSSPWWLPSLSVVESVSFASALSVLSRRVLEELEDPSLASRNMSDELLAVHFAPASIGRHMPARTCSQAGIDAETCVCPPKEDANLPHSGH